MTEIALYTFPPTGHQIRTIVIDGEPRFVLADLCAGLGVANARDVARRLPDSRKGVDRIDTLGGPQQMTTVDEPGAYMVVMRSDKDEAVAFQEWLAEVATAIRRSGGYTLVPTQMTELEVARRYLAAVEAKTELENRVAALAPAAEAWDVLASAEGDYAVADAAKVLARAGVKTGQRRLFRQLAELGWIYRGSDGDWHPYQRLVDRDYLAMRARTYTDPSTGLDVTDTPQVRITAAGLDALRRALAAGTDLGKAA